MTEVSDKEASAAVLVVGSSLVAAAVVVIMETVASVLGEEITLTITGFFNLFATELIDGGVTGLHTESDELVGGGIMGLEVV